MSKASMTKRKSGGVIETIKTIVYAVLIALGIRTLLLEPFNIPSGSMVPTLLVGDYLFVSKFSYGYSKYSLPSFLQVPFSGRIFGSLPHRGDVVVFKLPRDPSIDYIKRIIGLPGDHIQVVNGILMINGNAATRKLIGDYEDDSSSPPVLKREYLETIPGGPTHLILKETDDGWANNTEEYVVPPGDVFAMGDNRDNSQDSRYLNMVGYIPMENLVGRAQFMFFSVDPVAPWWQVWEWPFEIRWGRLFMGIH
jgi:signal peptidase I